MKKIQKNKLSELQHLLSIQEMDVSLIKDIFIRADKFLINNQSISKYDVLQGKTICNLFFENSTRTQTTFEIAAKRLSADVINLDIATSSQSKGESILDLINNLIAMGVSIFVVRHSKPGIPSKIAQNIKNMAHVINAGDGNKEHPTQALLDAYTIRSYKKKFDDLKVAIVGDIEHSRGVKEVRVIGPESLMPKNINELNIKAFSSMNEGLKNVDAILMLRIQKERMRKNTIPSEKEYFKTYGLNEERLKFAKKDCLVLHPGPINRGVEIDSLVADGKQSVILQQVKNGIAIRMAVMEKMTN